MEKSEKNQRKELGKPEYLNKNCWLVKSLNYTPYKRCQYCDLKFRNCLFLHYQVISLILILFFLILSFIIDGRISELVIISIFVLVIIYGYFFNKSTEKIIKANFAQRKAKEALEELTETLQQKVDDQTKELQDLNQNLEIKVQERTSELEQSRQEIKQRVEELEKFYKLTVGRELRMIELKKEIAELEEKLNTQQISS